MTTFKRSQAPIAAEWVLALRSEFGDQVKVTYIKEKATEQGEPWQDSKPEE